MYMYIHVHVDLDVQSICTLPVILDIIIYKCKNHSDVGMHHTKNRGNKEIPLTILLSRILAQSCATPLPY